MEGKLFQLAANGIGKEIDTNVVNDSLRFLRSNLHSDKNRGVAILSEKVLAKNWLTKQGLL